jgi:hypothetical protein
MDVVLNKNVRMPAKIIEKNVIKIKYEMYFLALKK